LAEKKKILAVDDEPDVLEVLTDVLDDCDVDTAQDFETAKRLLETNKYDLAILDILGVRGLDLLDIAVECCCPTVMLTANALDPGNIMQSMLRGAVSFVPKEDIGKLDCFVCELFELMGKGESTWHHTMKRLAPLLDEKFGGKWRDAYQDMGLIDT
jgi:DNA-binding NtrC family response regulator